MNKWSASPAIPERGFCAQIFDASGIDVVALGATDEDTATVEQIVKAHNDIVDRLTPSPPTSEHGWPDPERRGAPRNPGVVGEHWLKPRDGGRSFPVTWTNDGCGPDEFYWYLDDDSYDEEDVAKLFDYEGPCLRPEEVAKLCDESARKVEANIEALLNAAGIAMDGWQDSTTDCGKHQLLTRVYVALLTACDDNLDVLVDIEAAYKDLTK
jgi:hypothetical protein